MSTALNRIELESKVQAIYRDVAQNPHGGFHFEMGRALAERLGYRPADPDSVPGEAIDSFAGGGYYFHFLDEVNGARVLDLGSGSGMNSFIASPMTGPNGMVIGLDMTDAQRAKAEALRRRHGARNITFVSVCRIQTRIRLFAPMKECGARQQHRDGDEPESTLDAPAECGCGAKPQRADAVAQVAPEAIDADR